MQLEKHLVLGINGSASEVCFLAKEFEVAMLIYFEFQLRDTHTFQCYIEGDLYHTCVI